MLLCDLLESFSDQASLVRRFDFMQLDNRRFIYDPVSRRLIIGGVLRKSRSLEGSHAEDWFNVTGSNRNFDRCIRGWIGVGGGFRNGVIHFAPQANILTDGAFAVLQLFANNNAGPKCKVVGSSDGNSYRLGDLPVKFPATLSEEAYDGQDDMIKKISNSPQFRDRCIRAIKIMKNDIENMSHNELISIVNNYPDSDDHAYDAISKRLGKPFDWDRVDADPEYAKSVALWIANDAIAYPADWDCIAGKSISHLMSRKSLTK